VYALHGNRAPASCLGGGGFGLGQLVSVAKRTAAHCRVSRHAQLHLFIALECKATPTNRLTHSLHVCAHLQIFSRRDPEDGMRNS
jgi:hypothetical protein